MPTRKFLGALCLGLPAAMAAHFLTFGGAHTLGGAAHLFLMDAMVVAVCASILALCAGALYLAAGAREGSILAARLERFLPSVLALALSAAGWFALIEQGESAHATPIAVAALAILCIAVLLRVALGWGLRLLAAAALCLFTLQFTALERERFDSLSTVIPARKRAQLALSRYCRPPPRLP
ncbi:MAG: hypothetical protein JO024_01640 [Candidatus Eremiobacteraeota bacterium]|nr:hypothetical protein [Candidatus Eremiobacteraeota bacterium]